MHREISVICSFFSLIFRKTAYKNIKLRVCFLVLVLKYSLLLVSGGGGGPTTKKIMPPGKT